MIEPKWPRLFASALGLCFASAVSASAPAHAAPACIGPASDLWINLTVDRVRNSKGQITATLYPNEPKRFLVKHLQNHDVPRVERHDGKDHHQELPKGSARLPERRDDVLRNSCVSHDQIPLRMSTNQKLRHNQ
jgi:hypothetical protein